MDELRGSSVGALRDGDAESLVRHLHAFIGDVALTEAEWQVGDRLPDPHRPALRRRSGRSSCCSPTCSGASMATVAVNDAGRAASATEATVLGPFFVDGAPLIALGGDIVRRRAGQPCHVSGTVRDIDGDAGRRAHGSRSGSPTRTASTTCSTRAATVAEPRASVRRRRRRVPVLVGEARAVPDPARRAGRRAAAPRPAAVRCGRRTSTSWSARPACAR